MAKKAYLCRKLYSSMKQIRPYIGVAMIVVGTLTLAVTRLAALRSSNALLLTGLLLIAGGIVVHVQAIKHASND